MPPIRHSRKPTDRPSLDDILDGPDEFGLLDVRARRSSSSASPEVAKFEEINDFFDQHGCPPDPEGELSEKLLARRLAGYRANSSLHPVLRPYDRHGLIPEPDSIGKLKKPVPVSSEQSASSSEELVCSENVTSLDDIFASAEFADLGMGDPSIFDLEHVPSVTDRSAPDEIAQRTVCHDFYKFEPIFRDLHEGIKGGGMKVVRFQKASQVRAGDAFILEGVLCLIDEVGEYRVDNEGRYDPRLRVIFENGTESNHLLRSLAKRLYTDETGRRIVPDADSVVDTFNNISHKDKRVGEIYFVATLSENPVLKAIPNLVKIGYTELTVEERTKNATRETTYLEAPVRILGTMECYNLNPSMFETLIQGFLHAQRINLTLVGRDGKSYKPKEWFSVPLETAREVVRRIIDGSIVHYRMDNTTGRLVRKHQNEPSPSDSL